MKGIVYAVFFSLASLQAIAGDIEERLKQFEAAIQKTEERGNCRIADAPNVRKCIAESDLNGAIGVLRRFKMLNLPPKAEFDDQQRKTISDFLSALEDEQKTRDEALLTPVNTALEYAAAGIKKAKTATDLDAVLEELTAATAKVSNQNNIGQELKSVCDRAGHVRDFVAQYQEYLTAAKAGGYDQKAREIARTMADNPGRLLPRSELLAKAYELEPAETPKEAVSK